MNAEPPAPIDEGAASMAEKLTALTSASQFASYVGSKFRLFWGQDAAADIELISATALGAKSMRKGAAREPFSLVFRASVREFYLPQGIYRLEHERFGPLDVFLVPIGPDDSGMRFEAIFN